MSHKKDEKLNTNAHQAEENQKIRSKLSERLHHIGRKMSRGASDIFRMIKSRGGWNNRQSTGSHAKGHHKPK
jgi:hypothetical protein